MNARSDRVWAAEVLVAGADERLKNAVLDARHAYVTLLCAAMLDEADAHPEIGGFRYETIMEWGFGSGEHWSVWAEVDTSAPLGNADHGRTVEEKIADYLVGEISDDVDVWQLVTGSKERTGKITVTQLRRLEEATP